MTTWSGVDIDVANAQDSVSDIAINYAAREREACMSLPLDAEPDRIRAAEERVAFLSAAVESCDDAVVSVDNDGLVASWTRNAERLFGYGGGDGLGPAVPSPFLAHQRQPCRAVPV